MAARGASRAGSGDNARNHPVQRPAACVCYEQYERGDLFENWWRSLAVEIPGSRRLLFLSGERVGVGSALIVADEESGRSDHSLQAGHLIVRPHGPRCSCGARGCLELFVDGRAIAAALGLPEGAPSKQIREELISRNSQPSIRSRLTSIVRHLEIGLISLVNTLAPDRVVLSGFLSDLAEIFQPRLADSLSLSIVAQIEPVAIVSSTL